MSRGEAIIALSWISEPTCVTIDEAHGQVARRGNEVFAGRLIQKYR